MVITTKAIVKTYSPGEKVYVKLNRHLGNMEDLGTTVEIDNRIIHKGNIRFLVTAP